ncbi:MAG: nickel-dependent lactate racemase [Candidatus Bathyarchaeota archaeon]|nr:nickel-dependent lactate racemase [Candidatus Bathyarchaeota archaeon]
MVEVWLPYGESEVCLTIPPENLLDVVEPRNLPNPLENLFEEIGKVLENPLGSPSLKNVIKPDCRVSIAVDKNLLSGIGNIIISRICDELKSCGIKNSNISIFIGDISGERVEDEAGKFLSNIPSDTHVKLHNPYAEDNFTKVGLTSNKTSIYVDKDFLNSDVKILVGRIGLHSYAGFSGGRQTILTVSSIKTIQQNYALSLNPFARVGSLDKNPVHLDLTEIVKTCKVDFIFDVVEYNDKPLKVFYGKVDDAFYEGVNYVKSLFEYPIKDKADIAVASVGGYPNDKTLYNAQEFFQNVSDVVKESGVVIFAVECSQGFGDKNLCKWMLEAKSMDFKELRDAARREFIKGLHKVFQLKVLTEKFKVIVVSALPSLLTSEIFKFRVADSVNDALEMAFRVVGKGSKVVVFRDISKVLPSFSPTTTQ